MGIAARRCCSFGPRDPNEQSRQNNMACATNGLLARQGFRRVSGRTCRGQPESESGGLRKVGEFQESL